MRQSYIIRQKNFYAKILKYNNILSIPNKCINNFVKSAYATLYGFVINGKDGRLFSLFSNGCRLNLKSGLNFSLIFIKIVF